MPISAQIHLFIVSEVVTCENNFFFCTAADEHESCVFQDGFGIFSSAYRAGQIIRVHVLEHLQEGQCQ